MDKCLVTTLQGNVEDNTGLDKFGEGSITLPAGGGSISKLTITPTSAIKNLNGATYSDDTLTWTNSTKVIFDKYKITYFRVYNKPIVTQNFIDQWLKLLEYAPMTSISIDATSSEDVSLNLVNKLKNIKNVTSIDFLTDFPVTLNVNEYLDKCPRLIRFNTQYKDQYEFPYNLTLNIDAITNKDMPNFNRLVVKNSFGVINGNMVNLPYKTQFFSVKSCTNTKLTWSGTRPASSPIIAMENVNLGNYVDAMLIEQATHPHEPVDPTDTWNSKIIVSGTRTSASDDAVAILKSKGLTIIVNGETL